MITPKPRPRQINADDLDAIRAEFTSDMTESRQVIENSDRGITLNKQLAWTIGGGLIGAGLYVGLTIATLSTQVAQSRDAWQEATLARQQLETRVRVVEIAQASQTAICGQFRSVSRKSRPRSAKSGMRHETELSDHPAVDTGL